VAGIIGDPVRHSLSPLLHNAGFGALGLDWVYVAFPVPAGQGVLAAAAMRTLGIDGLSVTMPHKAEILSALDRLTPTAERLYAVNTVVRDGADLVGHSTDGDGFVDALRSGAEGDPEGRRVMVLGTGGSARAVCLALAEAGAAQVCVVGRRSDAVAATVALCGGRGRAAAIEEVGDVELVVNATPVGMGAVTGGGLPFDLDPARLGPGQAVVDLVYYPLATALVVASRDRGATASNGIGMLVHQAARQFTLWTGQPAPIEAMEAAARSATSRPWL
jgi:shikimate dehydrogenase